MAPFYACNANIPEGDPILPIGRRRVREGKFFVPDCADWDSKFGLPGRVKLTAVYGGWSCFNCVHLMEAPEPFTGPGHASVTGLRTMAKFDVAEPDVAKTQLF